MAQLGLADYGQEIEQLDTEELLEQLRRARQCWPVAGIAEQTEGYAGSVKSLLDRMAVETLGLSVAESRVRD
jgi:hypothetical protein